MSQRDEAPATQGGIRKPKDRDFLETREGLFFCVTGYLHPPTLYTAFLKYSPNPLGTWKKGTVAYRREIPYYHVRNVAETIRYLEEHYPHYVHDCLVRNIRFSMVPHEQVARYYDPRQRLKEIIASPRDPLEEDARGLVIEIADRASVSLDDLGVTGSILIGLHNPVLSDINLLVYGWDNAREVRAALRENKSSQIRWLNEELVERWIREMVEWFPLTAEESRYSVGRRWNYGFFRGRFFGIHPTRTDSEISERYGDHIYRSLGPARIRAVVIGSREALFQPAIYRIRNVQVLSGDLQAGKVSEIVSYEGRFRDLVEPGQSIEARGKLESVDGVPQRVVIGTTQMDGREYIKPLSVAEE